MLSIGFKQNRMCVHRSTQKCDPELLVYFEILSTCCNLSADKPGFGGVDTHFKVTNDQRGLSTRHQSRKATFFIPLHEIKDPKPVVVFGLYRFGSF